MRTKKHALLSGALVALGMSLTLTACHDDNEPGVDLSRPISLNFTPAALGAQSRVTFGLTGATFGQGDQVGLYMDGTGYDNILYTCDAGSAWSTASDLYWPDAGTYTFRAYYPYRETVADETAVPVTLSDDQGDTGKLTANDYMWGTADRAASNGAVSLTLDHKMSLLKLDITAGTAISPDEIKAMTPAIHGTMPAEGTWNLATGVITPATAGTPHTSLTPYVEDNGDGTLTCYALVMPGTAFNYGDKFFSLTDAGGTTYSYYLNISGGFTAGASTYCDIDLTVHRTGIELSGFGISSWTPNEDATGSGNVSMD